MERKELKHESMSEAELAILQPICDRIGKVITKATELKKVKVTAWANSD